LRRYQEIAEHAFNVIQKQAVGEGRQRQKLRHAPQPLNVFIAQEVYRVLLFSVFLAQNVVVRHVPYAGKQSSFCSTRCQVFAIQRSHAVAWDVVYFGPIASILGCRTACWQTTLHASDAIGAADGALQL